MPIFSLRYCLFFRPLQRMGHVHLGTLPQTRAWKDVVRLLTSGASAESVAAAAQKASDKAFASMTNDPGFRDAVALLSELAVAARKEDPVAYLAAHGLKWPSNPTIVDIGLAVSNALEAKTRARGNLSDLAILANGAMVSAVTQHLRNVLGDLIIPTGSEVHQALNNVGREAQFGKLARTFFFHVAKDCQGYFLSKTLAAQIGDDRAFPTTAQLSTFEAALEKHAYEASEIVQRFSAEWFSKNYFEGGGVIPPAKAAAFGWRALGKIREEMTIRAKPNAS